MQMMQVYISMINVKIVQAINSKQFIWWKFYSSDAQEQIYIYITFIPMWQNIQIL